MKYDFLIKQLEEGMKVWSQDDTGIGSMYDIMKKLHDFYNTHTIEECTHEAETELWNSLQYEMEPADEFMNDIEGGYEDEEVEEFYGMELHQALIMKLPEWVY